MSHSPFTGPAHHNPELSDEEKDQVQEAVQTALAQIGEILPYVEDPRSDRYAYAINVGLVFTFAALVAMGEGRTPELDARLDALAEGCLDAFAALPQPVIEDTVEYARLDGEHAGLIRKALIQWHVSAARDALLGMPHVRKPADVVRRIADADKHLAAVFEVSRGLP